MKLSDDNLKRRPRGRPESSENVDIRENILNAAEKLFALQGFSATAIRQIADDVGVNTAMVHYYFGSKMKLLQAVMNRVLEPLASSVSALQNSEQVNLQEFVKLIFSTLSAHQYLPQLIVREVFLPGGKIQQQFLENFAPRVGGQLPGIVQKEQQSGRLSTDFDPKVTAILILSLCFFPFMARPAAEQALGIDYDQDGLQSISEHISRLLERGLRK